MTWLSSFLNTLDGFIGLHPYFTLMIVGAFIAGVGQLKAPTKDSPTWYRIVFAVLNFLSLQFGRMFPKVENSPNFQQAVNLQQTLAGQPPTPVQVPPKVEDTK